jgi:general L-amino acid transport system permease protein
MVPEGERMARIPGGSGTAIARAPRPAFWRDVRVIRGVLQVGFLLAAISSVRWLLNNLVTNLDRLGIRRDFGFLDQPAGFSILGSPDFRAQDTIRQALIIGMTNAIRVALLGILLALIIGVIVGVARLSSNWLVARSASIFVEALRNIPPLVLLIFFYLAVIAALPRIQDATFIGDIAIVSNRGIWVAWFEAGEGSRTFAFALLAAVALAYTVARWRTSIFDRTGSPHRRLLWSVVTFVLVAGAAWLVLDPPITLSLPVLDGRVVVGGAWLYPEYLSLLIALVLYAASFIAEIVRGSILAVHRGQTEAADSLGLSSGQRMRYVVLPQALRIATPAIGNEFLNLAKNVSLGIAVGFAEILRVANTAAGNGQPAPQLLIVVLLAYLTLSLVISVIVNVFNRRLQVVER